jgi:hypothetical protein
LLRETETFFSSGLILFFDLMGFEKISAGGGEPGPEKNPSSNISSGISSGVLVPDRARLCKRPVVCLVTYWAAASPAFNRGDAEDVVEKDEEGPFGQYEVCSVEVDEAV